MASETKTEVEKADLYNLQSTKDEEKFQKGKKTTRKRHGSRNQHRHKSFVKWLVNTFDLDKSKVEDEGGKRITNRHILDVAGGKGEVSARLCMCHLQQVVMIDPRKADIVSCFETQVLPKIPNKWQRRLIERQTENPSFVQDTISDRFRQIVTTFDDYSVSTSTELQDAVKQSKLILGLHADGATEAIVNAALEYNKPFVVVPCCVFPNLFTSRRVENDDGVMVPVRSHEQFCRYLASKDKRFRTEELPFEGRNFAIWWDGK